MDSENIVAVVLPTEMSQDEQLGFMVSPHNSKPLHDRHYRKNYIFWLLLQNGFNDCLRVKSLDFCGQNVALGNITVIYYNSEEIWESELIPQKYLTVSKRDQQQQQLSYNILSYFIECLVSDEKRRVKVKEKIYSRVIVFIELLIYALTFLPNIVVENIHFFLQSKVDYTSSALQQILNRIKHCEKLRNLMKSRGSIRGGNLLIGRLVVMMLVDVLFGITVAYFISHHASVNDMYDTFCSWTKVSL